MRTVDQVRHQEKRREILCAAERCFLKGGFRGASISDICAEAGISPGHLYHYFENKEAIVAAMAELKLEEAAESLTRIVSGEGSVVSALLAEMECIKAEDPQAPAFFLEMLAEAARNPAIAAAVHAHSRGLRKLLADLLSRGQARGDIDKSLNAEAAAGLLIGIVDAVKILPVSDPEIDKTKVMNLVKVLISRFLAPAQPSIKKPRRATARRR